MALAGTSWAVADMDHPVARHMVPVGIDLAGRTAAVELLRSSLRLRRGGPLLGQHRSALEVVVVGNLEEDLEARPMVRC